MMRARAPNEIWRRGSTLVDLRRLVRRHAPAFLVGLGMALIIVLFLEIEKDVDEAHTDIMFELMAIEACQ